METLLAEYSSHQRDLGLAFLNPARYFQVTLLFPDMCCSNQIQVRGFCEPELLLTRLESLVHWDGNQHSQVTCWSCCLPSSWFVTCRLLVEYGSPGEVRLRSANRPARSTEASAQLSIPAGEHHLLS